MRRILFFFNALLQDMDEDSVVSEQTLQIIEQFELVEMVVDILSGPELRISEFLNFLIAVGTKRIVSLDRSKDQLLKELGDLEERLDVEAQEDAAFQIQELRKILS